MFYGFNDILVSDGYSSEPELNGVQMWRKLSSTVRVESALKSAYVVDVNTLCLTEMDLLICLHQLDPINPPINYDKCGFPDHVSG